MNALMLRQQIPMILAALAISSVIWLMAKQGELATERLQIPVVLQNVPPNVEITYEPRQVPVIVKFPQTQRSRIVSQNFEVTFDVADNLGQNPRDWAGVDEPILHTKMISLDDVNSPGLPQSVRVVEIVRQQQLQIEASLLSMSVPVQAQTTGELPPQYELQADIQTDPATVRVTAPPEILQRAAQEELRLLTDPVKLDGRTEDTIEYTRLNVPPSLELINPAHRNVQVMILVDEKSVQRTLPQVPIDLYVLSDEVRAVVNPPTAEVRLRGKISALERIDETSFVFTPAEFLPEQAGVEKRVELNISLREDIPASVRENIQIEGFLPTMVDVKFVESDPEEAGPGEEASQAGPGEPQTPRDLNVVPEINQPQGKTPLPGNLTTETAESPAPAAPEPPDGAPATTDSATTPQG